MSETSRNRPPNAGPTGPGVTAAVATRPVSETSRATAVYGFEEPFAGAPEFATRRGGGGRFTPQHLIEGRGFTALRLAVDAVCGIVALILTLVLNDAAGAELAGGQEPLYLLPLICIASLASRGMYRRRVRVLILDGLGPVVGAISVACMLVMTYEIFLHPDAEIAEVLARAWLAFIVCIGIGRILVAVLQRYARSLNWVGKPTIIVGAGRVGQQVARRLEEHPEYGLRPVGFLDASPPQFAHFTAGRRDAPVLGTPEELEHWVRVTGCEHVILAFSNAPDRGLPAIARQCEALKLEVSLVPRLFESITDRVALERLGGLPLLGLRSVDPKGWQFRCKYGLDRLFGLVSLVAVGPLLAVIALLVKLSSPGPVFFRQTRVGRDGQVFDLLKFRSMRPLRPDEENFVPAEGSAPGGVEGVDRRTAIGKFIRRTSLDELPQLINVLKGEMSMIGPRPERPEFVELFRQDIDRYADRHRVKSGITGWAQVHGLRGQTSLSDRVEWDNFYIENWSLWLDVKILLLTVGAVLRRAE